MSARAEVDSDHAFGSRPAFQAGVEEELFLVDPLTGRQAHSCAAVIENLPPTPADAGRIAPELHACQVELISAPRASVSDAIDDLRRMRRAVRETGAGLLGAGTHPAALEGEAEITDKERYARIQELLGDATATPARPRLGPSG